jgi:hypothetical protein
VVQRIPLTDASMGPPSIDEVKRRAAIANDALSRGAWRGVPCSHDMRRGTCSGIYEFQVSIEDGRLRVARADRTIASFPAPGIDLDEACEIRRDAHVIGHDPATRLLFVGITYERGESACGLPSPELRVYELPPAARDRAAEH